MSKTQLNACTESDPDGTSPSAIRTMRVLIGYSLDEVALTTGLTVHEVSAIEAGVLSDHAKLHRVVAALGQR